MGVNTFVFGEGSNNLPIAGWISVVLLKLKSSLVIDKGV